MKKVLLTNFSIKNFTGSEIDTVTIANYFIKLGYQVHIFTLDYGYPLLKEVNNNIKIITPYNGENLLDSYDVLWCHHWPLIDYILFVKKIKFDYIHFLSLSSFLEYEMIPEYYKYLNKVSVLSEEAKNKFKEIGFNTKKINIFPNSAPQKFFEQKKELSKEIKKICIVSNHVPSELLEAKRIFEQKNIIVDIYGKGFKESLIDDNVLMNYDVVISIGKTLYWSLSLGLPSYCYDYFGGDGYITINSFLKSYEYNFSGRFLSVKKTGKEIAEDILINYNQIITETETIRDKAYEKFCFENNMNKIIKTLNTKKTNYRKLYKKYNYLERKSSLFIEEISNKNYLLNMYDKVDNLTIIYYDNKGLSEENKFSYKTELTETYKKHEIIFKLPCNSELLKFDYSNKSNVCCKNIKINDKALKEFEVVNIIEKNNEYLSINEDPYILIKKNFKKDQEVKITFEIKSNY